MASALTAPLEPFSRLLFITAARGLNKRASARFARYQAKIGRPVPRSATDLRPDPGEYDGDDAENG